jgi:hypothetical protein
MPDRFTVALSAAAHASVAFLAACGSDATEPNEIANTRFVNASATTSSISATNEGRVVASGLAFQNANQPSSCSTVEHGGDEEVKFTLGGTTNEIGSVKAEFIAKSNYSVVFYAPNTIAVYPDIFTAPPSGQNALRFINATGSAGDVYVTVPATNPVTPVTGSPNVANLGSNSVSGFNSGTAPGGTFNTYPNGNTRIRLFNVGSQVNPRADFTIGSLPSNRVATVVLTAPSASGATGFLITVCGS